MTQAGIIGNSPKKTMKKRLLKINKVYKIPIPHLGFEVIYGVLPKEFVGRHEKSVMLCEDTNKNTSCIIFKNTPTDMESAAVAHEIIHALQFMYRRRNIRMEEELEHMGYLMQYIFNEIYNRKYETKIS